MWPPCIAVLNVQEVLHDQQESISHICFNLLIKFYTQYVEIKSSFSLEFDLSGYIITFSLSL